MPLQKPGESILETAIRLGEERGMQGRWQVSLSCRCGKTLEKALSNLDELPSCPKCGDEMLVDNVMKEKH